MKYKQYAVKFVTIRYFEITIDKKMKMLFIFKKPKRLTIKKNDGYWSIKRDNIVLCDEWGDTWENALFGYKMGVFNTFFVYFLSDGAYDINDYTEQRQNFNEEIYTNNLREVIGDRPNYIFSIPSSLLDKKENFI